MSLKFKAEGCESPSTIQNQRITSPQISISCTELQQATKISRKMIDESHETLGLLQTIRGDEQYITSNLTHLKIISLTIPSKMPN